MGNPLLWTASTAVTAVRNTIGDPSTGTNTPRWSAAEIDGYFNRAQIQVVLDAEIPLRTTWTFSLVAAQREYSMHANFHKAAKVTWIKTSTDRRTLQVIPFEVYRDLNVQDETRTGDPLGYYFWNKMGTDPTTAPHPPLMYIHPTPGSAQAGSANLEIHGYKHPDTIDSTTNPTRVVELPVHYVEAAVMYASYLILSDDGDPKAPSQLAIYERTVQKVVESMARRDDLSGPARIRPKGSRQAEWGNAGPPHLNWW